MILQNGRSLFVTPKFYCTVVYRSVTGVDLICNLSLYTYCLLYSSPALIYNVLKRILLFFKGAHKATESN